MPRIALHHCQQRLLCGGVGFCRHQRCRNGVLFVGPGLDGLLRAPLHRGEADAQLISIGIIVGVDYGTV